MEGCLARESRGFSQSALAVEIGVSQGKLSKVENGQAVASDELIQRLSAFLNYPPAFFFRNIRFGICQSHFTESVLKSAYP
jgi:transcriptional regulator with XRE-family HTH domain